MNALGRLRRVSYMNNKQQRGKWQSISPLPSRSLAWVGKLGGHGTIEICPPPPFDSERKGVVRSSNWRSCRWLVCRDPALLPCLVCIAWRPCSMYGLVGMCSGRTYHDPARTGNLDRGATFNVFYSKTSVTTSRVTTHQLGRTTLDFGRFFFFLLLTESRATVTDLFGLDQFASDTRSLERGLCG